MHSTPQKLPLDALLVLGFPRKESKPRTDLAMGKLFILPIQLAAPSSTTSPAWLSGEPLLPDACPRHIKKFPPLHLTHLERNICPELGSQASMSLAENTAATERAVITSKL